LRATTNYPTLFLFPDDENVQIMQISAGVDMSMAVSTSGRVYSWGKSDGGRLGLGSLSSTVSIPRRVDLRSAKGDVPIKAIDVECAFVHSLIVGLDGTLHQCGGVGIDGAADGQQGEEHLEGKPVAIPDFNIWHRQTEPKEVVETKKWQKYGKYELQGRSKMMGR
jgi:alpha-tubulin suppressor-like RCC1 family protein